MINPCVVKICKIEMHFMGNEIVNIYNTNILINKLRLIWAKLRLSWVKLRLSWAKLRLSWAKLSICGMKFGFDSFIEVLQFSCKYADNLNPTEVSFENEIIW